MEKKKRGTDEDETDRRKDYQCNEWFKDTKKMRV